MPTQTFEFGSKVAPGGGFEHKGGFSAGETRVALSWLLPAGWGPLHISPESGLLGCKGLSRTFKFGSKAVLCGGFEHRGGFSAGETRVALS